MHVIAAKGERAPPCFSYAAMVPAACVVAYNEPAGAIEREQLARFTLAKV